MTKMFLGHPRSVGSQNQKKRKDTIQNIRPNRMGIVASLATKYCQLLNWPFSIADFLFLWMSKKDLGFEGLYLSSYYCALLGPLQLETSYCEPLSVFIPSVRRISRGRRSFP